MAGYLLYLVLVACMFIKEHISTNVQCYFNLFLSCSNNNAHFTMPNRKLLSIVGSIVQSQMKLYSGRPCKCNKTKLLCVISDEN